MKYKDPIDFYSHLIPLSTHPLMERDNCHDLFPTFHTSSIRKVKLTSPQTPEHFGDALFRLFQEGNLIFP